ncbi:MAG: bifunctional precorrin-2 dehydrogenase/sirohydrochlorin ferrochelatase [Candidatus Melainabacteria bacterium]|jgi:siroheme synthase-like protein|nr:bifunctional precorrin-2 dehydrogenase/sirohydrochlorin ferrochelatase [Candidatus Melainabacteria bacterium]
MSAAYQNKDAPLFNLLPVNLKVDGRNVLITGGGKQSLREVIRFIDYGARVEVIASHVCSEIEELKISYSNRLAVSRRAVGVRDLERIHSGEFFLVVPCSHDLDENERVYDAAQQAKILCASNDFNVNCDIVFGQSVKRGHLKLAVSTDGVSHALERALIGRLEGALVNDIDRYVLFLNALSEKLKKTTQDPAFSQEQKQEFLRQLAESEEIYRAVSRGNFDEARRLTDQILSGTHIVNDEEAQARSF